MHGRTKISQISATTGPKQGGEAYLQHTPSEEKLAQKVDEARMKDLDSLRYFPKSPSDPDSVWDLPITDDTTTQSETLYDGPATLVSPALGSRDTKRMKVE